MQTHEAKTLEDIDDVGELRQDQTWEHARKFLAAAPDDPFADHLRWMEEDGHPIACVQVFLHQYPIGCAQVGMCLPEYPFVPPELRGRGYFKSLMADLFEWMREAGYPLAYDHGRKGLYTNLGFAPCFHQCMVLVRVEDALKVQAPRHVDEATEADVEAHGDTFRGPHSLGRGLQCRDERWRPDPACVRVVWRPNRREIDGFVVTGEVMVGRGYAGLKPAEKGEMLTVTDARTEDAATAASLLRTVADEALVMGFSWLRVNCRRDDPLARLTVLAGGELRWHAAQERDCTEDGEDVDAFYLADLRLAIQQLLPEIRSRWQGTGARVPFSLVLSIEGQEIALRLDHDVTALKCAPAGAPRVHLPRPAMARAIMGYATPTELCLVHGDCNVAAECRGAVDALFPAREPHLMHENWAFATPEQFGLVP